jgi:hypothetical protein
MSTDLKTAVSQYVKECHYRNELAKTKSDWETSENAFVVWRGQANEAFRSDWHPIISTSRSKQAAIDEFAGATCCLFKITVLPGIRYVVVNDVLGTEHRHADEDEVILEGGQALSKGGETKEKGLRVISYTYGPAGGGPPQITPCLSKGGRRWKMPRKMTRRYCKKTSCKRMGFTQKASCRPWKNCY